MKTQTERGSHGTGIACRGGDGETVGAQVVADLQLQGEGKTRGRPQAQAQTDLLLGECGRRPPTIVDQSVDRALCGRVVDLQVVFGAVVFVHAVAYPVGPGGQYLPLEGDGALGRGVGPHHLPTAPGQFLESGPGVVDARTELPAAQLDDLTHVPPSSPFTRSLEFGTLPNRAIIAHT